jgi:pyruvate dehydrogenase complex dehydrogenase (E1) component
MLKPVTTDIEALKILDERLRWLSAWTIHHANHIRENDDDLKIGGHQASCASMTAIMAALYFHALGENDRVAVKPHAGPVLHAIHYLLGSQSRESLENFRGFGGAQSYPSRTKDKIPVDFSTGSVGLGVAITLFASLVQDYLTARGRMNEAQRGRFVALIGDAELDEGNIYEAIIEGAKHDVRNLWWIVDYNRQSLDAIILAQRMEVERRHHRRHRRAARLMPADLQPVIAWADVIGVMNCPGRQPQQTLVEDLQRFNVGRNGLQHQNRLAASPTQAKVRECAIR